MAPTTVQLQACARAQASFAAVMAKWAALQIKISGPPAAGGSGQAGVKAEAKK
jgi:predicted lipoprotein